jgi:virginiamycin B lyase
VTWARRAPDNAELVVVKTHLSLSFCSNASQPNASRPRRIAITSDDAIWYTDYAGGHIGRFDPKTGDASEWPSPGGVNSGPYGIAVVKDVLWYSESGVSPNTLVRFAPKAEKFQT